MRFQAACLLLRAFRTRKQEHNTLGFLRCQQLTRLRAYPPSSPRRTLSSAFGEAIYYSMLPKGQDLFSILCLFLFGGMFYQVNFRLFPLMAICSRSTFCAQPVFLAFFWQATAPLTALEARGFLWHYRILFCTCSTRRLHTLLYASPWALLSSLHAVMASFPAPLRSCAHLARRPCRLRLPRTHEDREVRCASARPSRPYPSSKSFVARF